jgi:hypothetical protein
MLLNSGISALLLVLFLSCSSSNTSEQKTGFTTRDYLDVAEVIKTQGGPYVVNLKNDNGKQIVVVGCPHSRDTTSIEFDLIETYFRHLHPDVAFNEGGQVADSVHYPDRNSAILKRGESGLLKYLCDRQNIKMLNGDFTEKEEFAVMLRKYPKDELILYYGFERLLYPYLSGFDNDKPLNVSYDNFVREYMIPNGFPYEKDEMTFDYLTTLYSKYIGTTFELRTMDVGKFDFLTDRGKFGALARTSKVIRDSVLLTRISDALQDHNKIFVAFGGAHVIAIEPALKEMLTRN